MRACDLLISPDWWVSLSAAGYAHYAKLCLLPACSSAISETEPTVASAIFVVAITLAVVEHDLWPPSLNCPPALLLLLYEAFMAVIITNAAYLMIWIPLVTCCALLCSFVAQSIAAVSTCLGLQLGQSVASWLQSDVALDLFLNVVAVFILMWMIVATDVATNFCDILKSWRQRKEACDDPRQTEYSSPERTPIGRPF